MKTCKACQIEKELTEYSKNKRSADGLQDRCKACCKQYRDQNKEKNKNADFSQITSLDCTKCNLTKEVSAFSPKINSPHGFDYWCKECRQAYAKEYRDENIEEAREYTNDRRAERIIWMQGLKTDKPCIDCNQIYEPYCMDYDHIPGRGEKIESVTRMVIANVSKEDILLEIAKCDLVCLLCHNKRTRDRFNNELGIERKYRPHEQRNIDIINEFRNKPCVLCNQQYDLCNMQIDHIDPSTKLYDVCQLKSRKEETLRDELKKCQVLCALCHRRKSIYEQQADIYPEVRPKTPAKPILFRDDIAQCKECSVCHITKNFTDFSKQQKAKDGLTTACRECLSIAKKKKRGTYEENPLPSDQKECTQCEIVKHESEFSKRMDGGLNSWCKECFNEYRREKRKTATATAVA
jgi:hypothetical protein